MNKKNEGSSRYFNAYYEDNALLIQFIVVEFIQTYHLISEVEDLSKDSLDSIQTIENLLSSLTLIFIELVGSHTQQEGLSLTLWTKGCLSKLKEYCEQQSRNTDHQDEHHVTIHMAVHQVWLIALHNLELLNALHPTEIKSPKSAFLLLSLKRNIKSLQTRFKQVVQSIPRLIINFWDNENVLLYLLREKPQLMEIFGSDFLYKKLKCPIKSNHYVQLLIQRYLARGFDSLPPKILEVLATEGSFP